MNFKELYENITFLKEQQGKGGKVFKEIDALLSSDAIAYNVDKMYSYVHKLKKSKS